MLIPLFEYGESNFYINFETPMPIILSFLYPLLSLAKVLQRAALTAETNFTILD